MRYVAIAHKDPDTAYGLIIPDVPGCFTAGDTLEEAVANATEALAGHLDGEAPPPARDLDQILNDPELAEDRKEGVFVYVTYPFGPGASRSAVSVAPDVIEALDREAQRTGMSRDHLIDKAVRAALKDQLQPA